MQGFTVIDFIILVVYLGAVLVAGLFFAKKDMKGKEYFKGDGTIPWWVTSVSIFATLLSPISFLSLAGNSYAGTWIMWFAQLGMLIAIPLAIRFFLPVYAKLDIDTAYHYLELRFGSKALRILGAVMFIVYQIGRMSIIMYLPCMVLASLTGISVNLLILVMGVIAIIYSYTGGLKSVLWTDFIQGTVLIVGIVFALIFLLCTIDGGFGAVWNALTAEHKFLMPDQPIFDANILRDSVFLMIVGAGLNTLGSYVSSQDIVQRFTTTTDTKQLNKMMRGNGLLSIGLATVFYLIGTGLYVFYQQNPCPCSGAGPDLRLLHRIRAARGHHRSAAGCDLCSCSVHSVHRSELRGFFLDPGHSVPSVEEGNELRKADEDWSVRIPLRGHLLHRGGHCAGTGRRDFRLRVVQRLHGPGAGHSGGHLHSGCLLPQCQHLRCLRRLHRILRCHGCNQVRWRGCIHLVLFSDLHRSVPGCGSALQLAL